MNEHFQDHEFEQTAAKLRLADQSVSVDAKKLTKRLVQIRVRKKRIVTAASLVVMPVLALISLVVVQNVLLPENLSTEIANKTNAEQPEWAIADSGESGISLEKSAINYERWIDQVDLVFENEALARTKAKLEKEIELLKKTHSTNEWLLTRELASRDGLAISQ